jgi:UDP-glucose/GDP-mannose dehydrogenase family, UDP binding domain
VSTCTTAATAAAAVHCTGAHAIAVLTEWDEFKTLDYAKIYKSMAKPAFVFDGRNIIDSAALREIGFEVRVTLLLLYNTACLYYYSRAESTSSMLLLLSCL